MPDPSGIVPYVLVVQLAAGNVASTPLPGGGAIECKRLAYELMASQYVVAADCRPANRLRLPTGQFVDLASEFARENTVVSR